MYMPHLLSYCFHLSLLLFAAVARADDSQVPAVAAAHDSPFVRRVGLHRTHVKALTESDDMGTAVRRVAVVPSGRVEKENASAPLEELSNQPVLANKNIQAMVVGRQGQIGHDVATISEVLAQPEVRQEGVARRISSGIVQLLSRSAEHARTPREVQFPLGYPYMTTTGPPGWPAPAAFPFTTAPAYGDIPPAAPAYGDIPLPAYEEGEEEDDGGLSVLFVIALAVVIGAVSLYTYRWWLTRQVLESAPDTRGRLATDFHRDKFGDTAADAINDAKKSKSKYTRSDIQDSMQNQHTDSDSEGEPSSPIPKDSSPKASARSGPGPLRALAAVKALSQSSTGGSSEAHKRDGSSPPRTQPYSMTSSKTDTHARTATAMPAAPSTRSFVHRSSDLGAARPAPTKNGVEKRVATSFVMRRGT